MAEVDESKRSFIVKNHTATHLLHQALKDVLGDHVNQAGSLVTSERLRFDFSHYHAVTKQELVKIEQIVNEKIWESIPLKITKETLEDAKNMGAMALFGEKYGDIVRVVKVGDYSMELCGGCHVVNTSEIGLFKIISESGIGAGIRRIEAVTSKQAYELLSGRLEVLQQAAQLVKANEAAVPEKIEGLFHEMKQLKRKRNHSALK